MPTVPAGQSDAEPQVITTTAALAALCGQLRQQSVVALDVEFIWRKTYYPQVALIQVAGEDGLAALLDPLAIEDPAPLGELLADTSVLKLLHAGSQDLAVFQRYVNAMPKPFVDTQIAAAMVGMGYNIGYAALVENTCGVTLAKGAQTSDWLQRPLSPTQVKYAANEVTHLIAAWAKLREELEARGRLQWALDDSDASITNVLETKPAYQGVSGYGKLNARGLTVLKHLADWREARAQDADRPVRWIVDDAALIDLATRLPRHANDLASREVPGNIARRNADDLLDAIEAGLNVPREDQLRPPRRGRPTNAEKRRAKAVLTRVRSIAAAHDLPPELIAPRRIVESLAYDPDQPDHPLLNGWRATIVRDELIPLLSGAEYVAGDEEE